MLPKNRKGQDHPDESDSIVYVLAHNGDSHYWH